MSLDSGMTSSAVEKMKATSIEVSAKQTANPESGVQNTSMDTFPYFRLAMPVASILAAHQDSTEARQDSKASATSTETESRTESYASLGVVEIAESFDTTGQPASVHPVLVQHIEPEAEVPHAEHGASGILDSKPATHTYLSFLRQQSPMPDSENGDDSRDGKSWYLADRLRWRWNKIEDDCGSDSDQGDERLLPDADMYRPRWQRASSHQAPDWLDMTQDYYDSPQEPSEGIAPSHACKVPSFSPGSLPDDSDETDSVISFESASSEDPADAEDLMDEDDAIVKDWIFLADDGIVRISPGVSIVSVMPGKPNKVVSWSIENTGKIIWEDVIRSRRSIASSCSTIGHRLLESCNKDWILDYARAGMQDSFPGAPYYHGIQAICNESQFAIHFVLINIFYCVLDRLDFHFLVSMPLAPCNPLLEERHADGSILKVDQHNLSISQLIKRMYMGSKLDATRDESQWRSRNPGQPLPLWIYTARSIKGAMVDELEVAEHVKVPENHNPYAGEYELQKIDWGGLTGYGSDEARETRDLSYRHFRNMDKEVHESEPLREIANAVSFVSKEMHTRYKASAPHFQLRNLMAVQDHLHLIYSSDRGNDHSKVYRLRPYNSKRECIIDLSKTSNETVYASPVRITTLALSQDPLRSVCIVGGYDGEYALRSVAQRDTPTVVGLATLGENGIINHASIPYTERGAYHAILSCNDHKIRILDIQTNTFLHNPTSAQNRSGEASGHSYPWPINCTAASPDGRLRVVVGDTPDVIIANAETGFCERLLKGHYDYGFACAWSPDGTVVATANQDRLVNLYDTRTWRIFQTFKARGPSCYRSMKFSPVGGGSKCLLLAESADRVTAVNASSYNSAQTKTFYGEIAGIDFVPDGASFWIANADEKFGGMMNYERKSGGQRFGLGYSQRANVLAAGGEYRDEGYNEWIGEAERFEDPRCVNPTREGPVWNVCRGNVPMIQGNPRR